MQNTLKKLRQLHLKAYTLMESLVTLSVVSFLVLSLSGTVQQIFQKTQETIFFMSFEQLYTDSQQLALYSRQGLVLQIQSEEISNGYQTLAVPDSVQLVQPLRLNFQANGGNSSLAKVQFQTQDGLVQYQLYLGSGRYKHSKR